MFQPQTRPWNPAETLHLPNDNRCLGYDHAIGFKCERHIDIQNSHQAKLVLDIIAAGRPDAEFLEQRWLRELAEHGLCELHRAEQVDAVVVGWKESIKAVYPTPCQVLVTDGLSVSLSQNSWRDLLPTCLSDIWQRPEPRTFRMPMELQRQNPVRAWRPYRSDMEFDRGQAHHMESINEIAPSGTVAERFKLSIARIFGRPAGSPLPTRSSDVARGLKSSSEQHVRRLEPNEDCAICSDLLSRKPAPDLAWCSSGCGKSVHEACFNKWQASCLNSGKTPTCVSCRRVWEGGN